MSLNVLAIGESALLAAQVGLATTGNNISNAATPGYNQETAVQSEASSQNEGFGYVGSGTRVSAVQRAYNAFLTNQVVSAQSSHSELSTAYSQISGINNLLANSTSGVPTALQGFFTGVQAVVSDPGGVPSLQSMLSSAQTLASTFQGVAGQLSQLQQGVNSQLTSTVGMINSYASQIAAMNATVQQTSNANASDQPNTMLDQRDELAAELSQQVGVTVVNQGGTYDVFIGNGQPLVLGTTAYGLSTTASPTNPTQLEVGYTPTTGNGTVQPLPESLLTGGALGGLLSFRSQNLDAAQNQLGQIAVGLASTFNAQQELGQDENGNLGQAFFTVAPPVVTANSNNQGTAAVSASISNATNLTGDNYSLQFNGTDYVMTDLSNNSVVYNATTFPAGQVDGLSLSMTGTMNTGDNFLIQPTINGASRFNVAISNVSQIAAASPMVASYSASNVGSAQISQPVVSSVAVIPSLTLTYAGGKLTGFPASDPVTVTNAGVSTTYPAGTAVPYLAGNTLSFGGVTVTGIPAVAGSYTVNPATTLTYHSVPTTPPSVTANAANTGNLVVSASVGNAAALVPSDYEINYSAAGGGTYTITQLSDNTVVYSNTVFPPVAAINGINFSAVSGAPVAGDSFLVQTSTLTGFPPNLPVTETNNGTSTVYPAGDPVSYVSGSTLSYGGLSFSINGTPIDGDTFSIANNTGVGNNSNALLMSNLQSANVLDGGTTTYNGAYSQMISSIGNQTSQLNATSTAAGNVLSQAQQSQQSVSGVNLDQEASNLLQYQQAYQAAAKMMTIASQLFSTLLSAVG